MSRWRSAARDRIAELTEELPADATLAERRKALRGKGYPAHLDTSWGKRVWGQEVAAYLGRHGDSFGRVSGKTTVFPAHVHFPFRGTQAE